MVLDNQISLQSLIFKLKTLSILLLCLITVDRLKIKTLQNGIQLFFFLGISLNSSTVEESDSLHFFGPLRQSSENSLAEYPELLDCLSHSTNSGMERRLPIALWFQTFLQDKLKLSN